MKTIFTTLVITFTALVGMSQNNLTVNIIGLKTNEGTVMIQLFDANQKLVTEVKTKVTNRETSTQFKNLPTGTYAVQYYHDENNNSKMDTGMFGRPEEGYGYSNDARGFMGPADFEDQLFELKSNKTITLKTVL